MLYPLSYGGDVPAYDGISEGERRGPSHSYIVSYIVPTRELHPRGATPTPLQGSGGERRDCRGSIDAKATPAAGPAIEQHS